MKRIFIAPLMAAVGICGASCANKSEAADSTTRNNIETETVTAPTDKKVLVAYFSATGTTKEAARQVAEATGGELIEIAADPAYTDEDLDWNNKQSRSSINMADPASRPAIKPVSVNAADYDVVFLGYPIWWDLAPYEVYTYIDSAHLEGKTVIPFATSGGSTINNSTADLQKTYPSIAWQKGKLLSGMGNNAIKSWAREAIKN